MEGREILNREAFTQDLQKGIAQMKRSKIVPETSRPFGESLDIRESPEEEKDVGCGLQREREWWGEGTSSRDPILNRLVSLQKEV